MTMTNKEKRTELSEFINELMNEYGFVAEPGKWDSEGTNYVLKGKIKTFLIASVGLDGPTPSVCGRWADGKKFNLHMNIKAELIDMCSDIENYFALIDLKANNVTEMHDGLLYPEGIVNEMNKY